jgi:hypothetical protein
VRQEVCEGLGAFDDGQRLVIDMVVLAGSGDRSGCRGKLRVMVPLRQMFLRVPTRFRSCGIVGLVPEVDSLWYQHHLSANAVLQYSNMRRRRFGQSHLTADDRTQ